MEFVDFTLCFLTTLINPCITYQPPNTSVLDFCNDLTDYFEKNFTSPGAQIIAGDFNIPNQPACEPRYDHLQGHIGWAKPY